MCRLLLLLGTALGLSGSLSSGHPSKAEHARVVRDASALEQSYDYVIIGGGTAGLTVGDRLTEDGKTTVLVIEYGQLSDSSLISTVQGGFQGMSTQFMYSINSVPQTNLRGRTTAVLIGKVVGGSSAINAFMTIRGTAEDYDRWGSFFGANSTWSWNGLLPYFKKALNFVPPNPDVATSSNITYDTSYWGNTSTVYTSWPSFQYPGVKAIVDGFRGIPGVEFPPDSGSGKPGVYWYPQYSDPRSVTRSYARTGHWSNLVRSNYQLVTNSKVTKIVLNGTRAVGVEFSPVSGGGASTTITANKEVILAAGGIHSPQIMQLSGLGPKKLLESAKIPVIVDLPGVGQNFQDHPMLSSMYNLRSFPMKPSPQELNTNRTFRAWADEVWAKNKTGPYSIATGNAAAWLPFPVVSPRYKEISDALASQDPASALPADTDPTVVAGYKAQMVSYALAMRANGTAFYNFVINGNSGSGGPLVSLHPLSRGTVNIDPANPAGREPVVDYRALTNPLDRDVMVELLRFTRRVFMDNPAMRQYNPAEAQPGASVTSQSALSDFLTSTLSPTEYHPVGTCAMMPRELGGVVDEQLRVYGVQGLRIVDGSIMPTLPGANTCQTVYAVAEKAADMIKAGANTA